MTPTFARADEGQALVIVALAMFMLIGAIALTADWGFGLAMRRGMQTEADSAALAAARLLATTYVDAASGFGATQEDAWCAANAMAEAASPRSPVAVTESLSVEFSDDGASYSVIAPPSDCAAIGTATALPASTRFVRARASAAYDSLIGTIGRQHLEAAAIATARITGGPTIRPLRQIPATGPLPYGSPGDGVSGNWTAPNVAIWPIAVSYPNWLGSLGSLDSNGHPVTLFTTGPSADGNFFVTFAHYSARDGRHELVTESDYTGTTNTQHYNFGTSPLANSARPVCGMSTWDTNGEPDLGDAADCDVPNWLNYGFRGSVSPETDWDNSTWTTFDGQPAPRLTMPSARSSCTSLPAWVVAPSCADPSSTSTRGDWLETVQTGNVDASTARDRMWSFIDTYGRSDPTGDRYVVVNLPIWDCAQQWTGVWQTLPFAASDCSTVSPSAPIDRVHVLAVIPMAIYRSDVRASGPNLRVTAHWGAVLGDPGICASNPSLSGCDLNPLMNSAFLVPNQ